MVHGHHYNLLPNTSSSTAHHAGRSWSATIIHTAAATWRQLPLSVITSAAAEKWARQIMGSLFTSSQLLQQVCAQQQDCERQSVEGVGSSRC